MEIFDGSLKRRMGETVCSNNVELAHHHWSAQADPTERAAVFLLVGLADEEEVGGGDDSEESEEEGGGCSEGERRELDDVAAFELSDNFPVSNRGEELNPDAEEDERNADSEGETGIVVGSRIPDGGDFAQEESEAGDYETEAHHGQAGADPGEEGAFGGEECGGVGLGELFVGHGWIVGWEFML